MSSQNDPSKGGETGGTGARPGESGAGGHSSPGGGHHGGESARQGGEKDSTTDTSSRGINPVQHSE